jgi:hypothetical protein
MNFDNAMFLSFCSNEVQYTKLTLKQAHPSGDASML